MLIFLNKKAKAKYTGVLIYGVIILTLVVLPFGELPFNGYNQAYSQAASVDSLKTSCGEEKDLCEDPDDYCELTLTKSDMGYDPISPGEEIVYYLTLENTGTANCTGGGVRLRDYFDQRTTYVSHTLGDDYPSNESFKVKDDYLQWNFATMSPGDLREVWLTMKVDDDISCDSILVNKAKYYSNETGWSDYLEEETVVECQTGPVCGNGILESGEQCDDGNLINGDGCSNQCLNDSPACSDLTMYGIHDEGLDDSFFLSLNINSGIVNVVGPEREDYDIEAIDINPLDDKIYGLSGDTDDSSDKKKLLKIDRYTGIPELSSGVQLDIGSGQEYKGMSFHPVTGELWAAGDNVDLVTVDLSDGTRTVKKTINGNPEGLAWNLAGDYLYILYQGDRLDRYNNSTGEIENVCDNAPDAEGMEFDLDGNLVIGYHTPAGLNVDIYDPTTCQTVSSQVYNTNRSDIETLTFECTPTDPVCGNGILESGEQCDDGNLINGDGCSDTCQLEHASISGCKYNDSDNDGEINDETEKIPGWEIVLVGENGNSLFATSTVTDQTGCYSFTNLNSGHYVVAEEQRNNWTQTYPNPHTYEFDLSVGENKTNIDFGNYYQAPPEVGVIAGCKYNDENNNGVIDQNEGTISGWGITLTYPDGFQVSTSTNEIGCYAFIDLPLDTYAVSEENRSGWVQTYPDGDGTHTVSLTSPQIIADINFANYEELDAFCGDGIVNQPTEECDFGSENGNICTPEYGNSCQYCSNSCTLITVNGPYCGDGIVNGDEECDEGENNGSESCTLECTIPISSMDLSLTKEVDTPSVEVGNSVVFTITLENEGDLAATGVVVEDRLPNGLNYVSHNASKGYYSSDYGIWTVGDMASGEIATLSLVVKVNAEGPLTNVAEVMEHNEDDVDSTPGNDILSEDDQDEAVVTGTSAGCTSNCGGGGGGGSPTYPKLVIVKTADVAWTNPNTVVDYTISITNTGTALGHNLTLEDTLPDGIEYASSTIDGKWDLGNIAVNQTKTVEYQVKFPEGISAGDYTNTAVAKITNGNSAEDDATVEVRVPSVLGYAPILAIDKVVDRSFTNPGGEAVYTVTITNTNLGTLTANNVIMVDRLPDKFTFADDGRTVKSWVLGDLVPGESKSISFTVKIDGNAANGIYKNIATAYADNAPEVSDIEPLEVREIAVKGFVLPDTNGSINFFLSLVAGVLLIILGYLLRKYRQLQVVDL